MLLPKPQLSGSFSIASIHCVGESAPAGKAQSVKSALISAVDWELGSEHSWLSDT